MLSVLIVIGVSSLLMYGLLILGGFCTIICDFSLDLQCHLNHLNQELIAKDASDRLSMKKMSQKLNNIIQFNGEAIKLSGTKFH